MSSTRSNRSANRPATFALAVLVGITLGATALAQVDRGVVPGAVRTDDIAALTPVDQGVADLGDLNTSNRLIPIDLRQPMDFVRLYQAPDDSGRLMRVSGGLSAVFPRSEYAASAGFVFPVIPAGTEFFIGPMAIPGSVTGSVIGATYTPPLLRPTPESGLVDSRLDLNTSGMTSNLLDGSNPQPINRNHASRAHHGVTLHQLLTGQTGFEPTEMDAQPQSQMPTVWSSERYRRSRIAGLLERAFEHRRGS